MDETGDPRERRRAHRVASSAAVRYGPAEQETLHSRRLRDISSAGMFVVTDELLSSGTEVTFEILDDEEAVIVAGLARVVWALPDSGIGLEFIEIDRGEKHLAGLETAGDSESERPEAAKVQTVAAAEETRPSLTIGIDLGTSNTCASIVQRGRPMVIPTRYGNNTIPSVVTIDDAGKMLTGQAAARRMILEPERTVYGSKRLIGRTFRDELAEEFQPYFAYPLVEAPGQRFGAGLEERVVSMEEVASHVLLEVRQVAESHLRAKVERAVITVPAYFSEVQRRAVRSAAAGAGLEVARIVNEPTAAAVAYGFDRGEEATLVVFDLGGGTFDVSVLEVRENRFEVIASGGDNFLGGIDLDDLLASHLLEEFQRVERTECELDRQQLARLREAAEEAKRGLSVQQRLVVSLPQFARVGAEHKSLSVSVERSGFEEMAGELSDRMLQITTTVLGANDIDPHSVDEVLLVGGMTRMPLVQARVEELFGRKPSRRINPDEAVALGAALLAQEPEQTLGLSLVDVLPLSIGVARSGRTFETLLRRNASVPASCVHVATTDRLDQKEIAVPIFQGERSDAAANEYLGTLLVRDVPPGPPGAQSYELTLSFDEQCLLSVRAREKRTGAEVPVELDRSRPISEVVAGLGPYRGPKRAPRPKRRKSALGRIFSGLGKLLGR